MAAQQRSPRDLAELLGVSVPTARTRLRGSKPFDLVEIDRVATWLGTTPSGLLARLDGVGSGEE
jgi:transcriptional regulator with XRE-family HTH domain